MRRRTEGGEAPGWQGATRLRQGYGAPKFAGKAGERRWATENTGSNREYLREF
jgi:hypothetical protein